MCQKEGYKVKLHLVTCSLAMHTLKVFVMGNEALYSSHTSQYTCVRKFPYMEGFNHICGHHLQYLEVTRKLYVTAYNWAIVRDILSKLQARVGRCRQLMSTKFCPAISELQYIALSQTNFRKVWNVLFL